MVQALVDYLNAPGVVPLQRMNDNFDGDTINERWSVNTIAGSNTEQMSDGVDQGFEIITDTTSVNRSSISFNAIRHYEETGCKVIHVSQAVSTTSIGVQGGLSNTEPDVGDDSIIVGVETAFDGSNFMLKTERSTNTIVSLGVAIDANFHTFEAELRASSGLGSIDGVLSAVSTTNLPTSPLQPIWEVITRTTASRTGRIRYMEAYNT